MRKISWIVEVPTQSMKEEGVIEVEDDATEDEIDELVKNEVFNLVAWGWSEES